METKSKELEVAIRAALEAGKIVEKYFETEILKEYKANEPISSNCSITSFIKIIP